MLFDGFVKLAFVCLFVVVVAAAVGLNENQIYKLPLIVMIIIICTSRIHQSETII